MKRSIKNTIMIGMAAVLIGTSVITFSYADLKGNGGSFTPPSFSQSENMPGGFGNGIPDGNGFNNSDSQSDSQMPEMPDKNSSQTPQAPPSDSNQNSQQSETPNASGQQTPDDNSTQSSTQENSGASSSSTSVESKSNTLPSQNGFKDNMTNMRKQSKVLTILCYAFSALQIAILLMILVYLIISRFNKRSFNQIFPKNKTE